jgi:hypothetical protein
MKCPNCQSEVQPNWQTCRYCGQTLQSPQPTQPSSYPPPIPNIPPLPQTTYPPIYPPIPTQKKGTPVWPFIVGGVVFLAVIGVVIFLIVRNSQMNSPFGPFVNPSGERSGSDNGNEVEERPTRTPRVVVLVPTDTPYPTITPSATPAASCPGAEPQRLDVDEYAKVCTKMDRLIVREEPSKQGEEIIRIYTGTQVKVIGGARCSDDSSWWQIEVPAGTEVYYLDRDVKTTLSEPVQGWVREGSDDKDLYFLCPVN